MFGLGKPKVIAEALSPYSGKIKVVQGWGYRHISTDSIQHSGGIVEEIWDKAMKNRVKNDKSWLMLGVAGGCVLQLISKKYRPTRMVGVDIDNVIVNMAKKYFDLDKIPNLEIVIEDANKYVYQTEEKFDYVIGDLFGSDSPPQFVYEPKFLKRLKEIGETVFVNHLFNDEKNKKQAEHLKETIIQIGFSVEARQVLRNIVYSY